MSIQFVDHPFTLNSLMLESIGRFGRSCFHKKLAGNEILLKYSCRFVHMRYPKFFRDERKEEKFMSLYRKQNCQ